ncbi:Vitamin B12 import system permease protein BtuC [Streptomyces violaceorubidus]
MASGTAALISLLIVLTDPFNANKALTWLSGSTYGRTMPDVVPVARPVVDGVAVARRTELDLISLDEDTPRLLGLRLAPGRLGFLVLSVVLSATAVACAGTIGFVGLVAPHAARALVGRRHVRVVPFGDPPRRHARVRRRPARPHGHRPGPARRGADDGGDRDAVLPVSAGTEPSLGIAGGNPGAGGPGCPRTVPSWTGAPRTGATRAC